MTKFNKQLKLRIDCHTEWWENKMKPTPCNKLVPDLYHWVTMYHLQKGTQIQLCNSSLTHIYSTLALSFFITFKATRLVKWNIMDPFSAKIVIKNQVSKRSVNAVIYALTDGHLTSITFDTRYGSVLFTFIFSAFSWINRKVWASYCNVVRRILTLNEE